jgi:putative phosphoesterase
VFLEEGQLTPIQDCHGANIGGAPKKVALTIWGDVYLQIRPSERPLRVAVISDIHGNLTALRAVLPAVKDEADKVVCLGDVAATGPQPHETINLLRDLGYPCVMGNTDESILRNEPDDFGSMKAPEVELRRMQALDRWTRSQITSSDRKFLSTFKPTVTLRRRTFSLLCYHGSPRSNTEGILPTTPKEDLSEAFAGHTATIFAGGHTHAQMVRRWRNATIINPGSVGLPFESDAAGRTRNPAWAEYAIVTFEGHELKLELRRVRYNLSTLTRAVRSSGMPDPDWWLADWI